MNDIDYTALKDGANSLCSLDVDARGRGYLNSYPIYLKYFENTEFTSKSDFYIRASLVYSWMPRVLVVCDDHVDKAIEGISNLAMVADDKYIEEVAKSLNGSYIGASKLLHFQYPENFPIYDTKVFKNINGLSKEKNNNLYYKLNKVHCYRKYYSSVKSMIEHVDFDSKVHDKVNQFMEPYGYQVSAIRAVEFILFSTYNQ